MITTKKVCEGWFCAQVWRNGFPVYTTDLYQSRSKARRIGRNFAKVM